MRIVITRPAAQAQALVAALDAVGAQALALPLIDIEPVADVLPIQKAWRDLAQLACVMFVSANAVNHFLAQRPPGLAWPPSLAAASTGPGTSAALRAAGIEASSRVEPQGEDFDSEALWQQLRHRPWAGRQVLIVRGDEGRDWLAAQWRAAGAQVRFVSAYRRVLPSLDSAARALLRDALALPAEHLWAFSSSQALEHLATLAPDADWSASRAVASHHRIAQKARELGFGQVELRPIDATALRDLSACR
jgi:uroporphyrinogen-III synthase